MRDTDAIKKAIRENERICNVLGYAAFLCAPIVAGMFLAAIWTSDGRWAQSGVIVIVFGALCMGGAIIASTVIDQLERKL